MNWIRAILLAVLTVVLCGFVQFKQEISSFSDLVSHSSRKPLIEQVHPTFETNSDLLGAIDLCIREQPGRCHVVHLTVDAGIHLDEATVSSPRMDHVVKHLQNLTVARNMTMVFYTSDNLNTSMTGYPIVSHTTDNHRDHLLFPTPYLLRDLQSGHLQSVLEYCKQNHRTKRKNVVFFRGSWRSYFRIRVAEYGLNYSSDELSFDIKFTNTPNDERYIMMKALRRTNWTEKMEYVYLLTLPGGNLGSSQWEVYHDFVAGGVIVRYTKDKKEYWNYDAFNSSNVINFDSIDSLALSILEESHNRTHMANATRALACQRLQPEQIMRYSQEFLNEYGNRFGHIVAHNKTYALKNGVMWTPRPANGTHIMHQS